jgi:hypothetical protein
MRVTAWLLMLIGAAVAVVAGALYEASTSPIALMGIVCSGVGLLMLRFAALD